MTQDYIAGEVVDAALWRQAVADRKRDAETIVMYERLVDRYRLALDVILTVPAERDLLLNAVARAMWEIAGRAVGGDPE